MNISIVHISDLHLKKMTNSLQQKVIKMTNYIENIISRNENLLFLFTGDIAFSGNELEYGIAKELVSLIQYKMTKTNEIYFVFIPGNHDCDFSNEDKLRSFILNKGINVNEVDEEMYISITKCQKNFCNFANDFNLYNIEKFNNFFSLQIGETKLKFNLLNTAWMSKKNEIKGNIVIPNNYNLQEKENDNDIIITCMHHPFSWINPQQARSFEDIIYRNSDFIFMGHEHQSDEYMRKSLTSKNTVFLAKEFHNSADENSSGFKILRLLLDEQNQIIYDATYKGDNYSCTQNKTILTRNYLNNEYFVPSNDFSNELKSLDIPMCHPSAGILSIPQIFINPKITRGIMFDNNDERQLVDLNEMINEKFVLLTGINGSGKTTIIKKLALDSLGNDRIPIIIDGKDITTPNINKLENLINQKINESYINKSFIDFQNTEYTKKIIFIDNFNSCNLSDNFKEKVLRYFENKFNNVFISMTNTFRNSLEFNKSYLDKYTIFTIGLFGHKERRMLYEKWYGLNDNLTLNEINIRTCNVEKMIDGLLGKGVLISTPETVLLFLNGENEVQHNDGLSLYNQMYDIVIDKAFKEANLNAIEIRALKVCLSEIAYCMFKNNSNYLDYDKLDLVINEYNVNHDISLNVDKIIKKLLDGRLFTFKMDRYHFTYPCFYYYFFSKYIISNKDLHKKTKDIDYLFDTVYLDSSFQSLLFVCYFETDYSYILKKTNTLLINLLPEIKEYDFENQLQLIRDGSKSFVRFMPKKLPDNDEVIESRNKNLEMMDKFEKKHNQTEIDFLKNEEKKHIDPVSIALRMINLSGALIKSNAGVFEKNELRDLIRNAYQLSLRVINSQVLILDDDKEELYEFIRNNLLETEDMDSGKTREETTILLYAIALLIIIGILGQTAQNLGCQYIKRSYKLAGDNLPKIGYELFLISIELLEYGNKPFYKIENYINNYIKEERYDLQQILNILVSLHIQLYGSDVNNTYEFSRILNCKNIQLLAIK